MKTLKRLKNLLSGEENKEEEKTETPTGESVKQADTETTIDKITEKPEAKSVKSKDVKSKADDNTKDVKSKAKDKTENVESQSSKTVEKEEKPVKSKIDRSGKMTLLEGREEEVITRKNIDTDFKQEIIDAGAESVSLCFQCGTCTGACPSGRRTPYRIRQVVRKSVMGLKEEVIADDTIWMCATCYECQERCPRGIKIVDIVKTVRNFAAQAGYMAPAHKATGSFVIKTGHGVPINDKTMELRKSVGLGELPPTTHQYPGALEEVQKIMKATGFDNLIGWNWEKGELE
jgi:heterodisulfide reductase subunit C